MTETVFYRQLIDYLSDQFIHSFIYSFIHSFSHLYLMGIISSPPLVLMLVPYTRSAAPPFAVRVQSAIVIHDFAVTPLSDFSNHVHHVSIYCVSCNHNFTHRLTDVMHNRDLPACYKEYDFCRVALLCTSEAQNLMAAQLITSSSVFCARQIRLSMNDDARFPT